MGEKGYTPPDPDNLGAYLLLQLAEQGRPVETAAQFIASWFLSGELTAEQIVDESDDIKERVIDLMLNPQDIWDGLLVGSTVPLVDMFMVISMGYFGELDQSERNVKEILSIFKKDRPERADAWAWAVLGELETYCQNEGLIEQNDPSPINKAMGIPQKDDDTFKYHLSIIVNPGIMHDEETDILVSNQVFFTTSPLNLAKDVIKMIERESASRGSFPEEEQAAFIVNVSGNETKRWLMTWDQAQAISILNDAKGKLDDLSADVNIDWDDQFQGIQDMMWIAAKEYAGDS